MAKINSTFGAGYRIEHDFDARKFSEDRKRQERQAKRQRTTEETEKEETKRQTWMIPFNIICTHCQSRIGRNTKVYANVRKLGKDRKYLGKIAIFSLTIRCVFCSEPIVFETDPESRDYKLVKGGDRCEGDWKELRDAEKTYAEQKEQALVDENARQAALLEESQRNAEKAEDLTKYLSARSKMDLNRGIESALLQIRTERAAESTGSAVEDGGTGGSVDRFGTKRVAARGMEGDADSGEIFDEKEWQEALALCNGGKKDEEGEGQLGTSTEGNEQQSSGANPFMLAEDILPAVQQREHPSTGTTATPTPPTAATGTGTAPVAQKKRKSALSRLL